MVIPLSEGGEVVVVADSGIPTVQALVRWDPVGHAQSQFEERDEVGFPPAVHMAAIDGGSAAIAELVDSADLPASAVLLGPVELPAGERLPYSGEDESGVAPERMLVRVPRKDGRGLADALAHARASRSARKSSGPVRIQIDPRRIG